MEGLMTKVFFLVASVLGGISLSSTIAFAQSKSCHDQWYDMRTRELNGVVPRRGITPDVNVRQDIATCEASKDKKFKRIKSSRQNS
jgi:hypothetical protein